MKFSEFVNKNKNVVASYASQRIASAIPISEERDAFYNGTLFGKYDIVESNDKRFTILEQASNYYHVVDEAGNMHRKFASQLTKIGHCNNAIVIDKFHGYQCVSEEARQMLATSFFEEAIDNDDVGILKQLKEMDSKVDDYKPKDKMTVAKIIADVVGIPHDAVSDPTNLVNAAIRKAKKDPVLMKNKAILQNMLQIAREVGIKYSDNTFEVKESTLNGSKFTHEVTCDHHGSNQHVPLYTKTYKVHAKDSNDAIASVKKLVGGRNHKVKEISESVLKLEEVEDISEDEAQQRVKNVMDRVPEHKRDAARKTYNDARKKGQMHAAALNTMAQMHMKEDVEQIEELSKTTLASYSGRARLDATKKASQGAKAKKTEVAYSKFKKATTRLAGAAKADKKVFAKDWKERTGQNEAVEEPSAVSYKDLKAKIKKPSEPTSVVQKPEPATNTLLPAQNLDMATNSTTRKMIVKKLSDI